MRHAGSLAAAESIPTQGAGTPGGGPKGSLPKPGAPDGFADGPGDPV